VAVRPTPKISFAEGHTVKPSPCGSRHFTAVDEARRDIAWAAFTRELG